MQCGAKGISSFGKHDDVIKWKLFSALLAICAGNSPVSGEFLAQRPVTRNFDIFFDLRLNKRLTRQLWGWWFKTVSRPLWRQCNEALLLNKVTSISMVFDNNPNAFIVPQEQGTLSHGKAFYIIFLYVGNLLVIRGFPSHKGSVVCGMVFPLLVAWTRLSPSITIESGSIHWGMDKIFTILQTTFLT